MFMGLFEALGALASLDIGFFIELVLGNLLWVFIFAGVNHVLFKGKGLEKNTILFGFYIWAFREFMGIWGFSGFAASPFVFFALMAIVQIFVLEPKALGKHTAAADVAAFYGILFFFNF